MPSTEQAPREILDIGPLQVLPEDRLARVDGRTLTLSNRELRVLTELARRSGRVVLRDELYSLVWGRPPRPGDRSLDVYVRKLRVKLEAALPGWAFIHTHFGIGYRLAAEPSLDLHLDNTRPPKAEHTSRLNQ